MLKIFYMMFSDSQEEYHNEEVIVEALNLLLILHADHEVVKED